MKKTMIKRKEVISNIINNKSITTILFIMNTVHKKSKQI